MIAQCLLPDAKQTSDQAECQVFPRAVAQECRCFLISEAANGQKRSRKGLLVYCDQGFVCALGTAASILFT